MTDLERVEQIYDFILSLVITHKKVTVKANHTVVDFVHASDKYYAHTTKATAESEFLHPVYDLVKHEIADLAFGEDIEIIVNEKVFAIIK